MLSQHYSLWYLVSDHSSLICSRTRYILPPETGYFLLHLKISKPKTRITFLHQLALLLVTINCDSQSPNLVSSSPSPAPFTLLQPRPAAKVFLPSLPPAGLTFFRALCVSGQRDHSKTQTTCAAFLVQFGNDPHQLHAKLRLPVWPAGVLPGPIFPMSRLSPPNTSASTGLQMLSHNTLRSFPT